jgi:hypothetical protein
MAGQAGAGGVLYPRAWPTCSGDELSWKLDLAEHEPHGLVSCGPILKQFRAPSQSSTARLPFAEFGG